MRSCDRLLAVRNIFWQVRRQLMVMEYCLRSGLNFEITAGALKLLKEKPIDLIQTVQQSWLLSWDGRIEVLGFFVQTLEKRE